MTSNERDLQILCLGSSSTVKTGCLRPALSWRPAAHPQIWNMSAREFLSEKRKCQTKLSMLCRTWDTQVLPPWSNLNCCTTVLNIFSSVRHGNIENGWILLLNYNFMKSTQKVRVKIRLEKMRTISRRPLIRSRSWFSKFMKIVLHGYGWPWIMIVWHMKILYEFILCRLKIEKLIHN